MMSTHKISFWQFLFKIGDDYLTFLRDLTPAVLFLALALFMFSSMERAKQSVDIGLMFFFGLSSALIAFSVILINIVGFSKKMLNALNELHHKDEVQQEINREMFNYLWQETNSKQLVFFLVVNIVAVFMVFVFGIRYALNFYSSIGALGN
ncbi:hypothetical protein [Rodentibacter ratti]|nr:hypothetical protein [Rodentibacter ratti]